MSLPGQPGPDRQDKFVPETEAGQMKKKPRPTPPTIALIKQFFIWFICFAFLWSSFNFISNLEWPGECRANFAETVKMLIRRWRYKAVCLQWKCKKKKNWFEDDTQSTAPLEHKFTQTVIFPLQACNVTFFSFSFYLFCLFIFLPFFSLSFYFPHLSMTIIFTLTLPLSFCVCLSTFFHLLHISTSFDILLLSQSLSLTSVLIPIRRSRVHSFSFCVIAAAFYRLNNSKWFFDR